LGGFKLRLLAVEIEGYRSINEKVRLHCDPKITVVLAANDHGKTNLLEALRHLNRDHPFEKDRDLNWDREDSADRLPHIRYELALGESERKDLQERINNKRLASLANRDFQTAQDELRASESERAAFGRESSSLAATIEALSSEVSKPISENNSEAEHTQKLTELADARKAHQVLQEKILTKEIEIKTKTEQLYEAALSDLEGAFILTHGFSEDALEKSIQEARNKIDHLSAVFNSTSKALETKKQELAKARKSGEEPRITKATEEVTKLEQALETADDNLEDYPYFDLFEEIQAYAAEGKFQGLNRDKYRPTPDSTVPEVVVVERKGLGGGLAVDLSSSYLSEELGERVKTILPRVELVGSVNKISDGATRAEIAQEEFAFMRGIFYYAGLNRSEWDSIFEQNDFTLRRLSTASAVLNEKLQQSWSQGKELAFSLVHDSGAEKIELRIKDPVISNRFVRASKRSTGFNYFFALKTILHSRQVESPASSYIWLFDEPGLFLHPNGQHDLLQVIETLGLSNQVIYSTHSLFMINKNYPTRHRLIIKSKKGTNVDGKPFHGQWKAAIESLGLSLPGTILFASKVLLVEGDSDPIFLNSLLLKLIETKRFNVDLNGLSIVSTGDSKNADAIVRILTEAAIKPKIAALFDGDEGGRDRAKKLKGLLKAHKIELMNLDTDSTLEDYLIAPDRLFVSAVTSYVAKLASANPASLHPKFESSYADLIKELDEDDAMTGLADWSRTVATKLGVYPSEPSSVGIAREYALLLSEAPDSALAASERISEVVEWIIEKLELPKQTLDQTEILQSN
jgi:predicted ATP-dependent endonuclease of OLD family